MAGLDAVPVVVTVRYIFMEDRMTPTDWPLSTVSLLDGNLWEIFVWTGYLIPDACHDLPNVNCTCLYRVQIITPPDEHNSQVTGR